MRRIVEVLQERVAQLPDGGERDCARADLAACLARHGRYPEATQVLDLISRTGSWNSVALSTKLMFAEAMIRLQHELDPEGLDRLWRGHALATGARLPSVVVDFAAWLFHYNYNRNYFQEMDKWLRDCEAFADSASPHARVRLCLTFAAVTAYIGDQAATDGWYQRGRRIASSIGDEAFLAAAMYNRSAFGISAARLEVARRGSTGANLSQLVLEIESAENYARATANASATFLQRLWKGRALLLQDKPKEALSEVESALEGMPEARHQQIEGTLLLDIAICRRRLKLDARPARLDPAELGIEMLGADDQVVALSQLKMLDVQIEESAVLSALEHSANQTLDAQMRELKAMAPRFAAFLMW